MTTENRQRIVDAADALFYSRGIGQVGMDAVRDEAQVSLRALYKEFASKDELVVAVLDKRHGMWTSGVSGAVEAIDDPRERLLAIYDYLAEWFGESDFRGCGFINAFGELGAANPELARVVRDHKADFQRYVDALVEDAGGPAWLGPQLAVLAEGAQTTAAIAGTSDAARHARAAAVTLVDAAFARA